MPTEDDAHWDRARELEQIKATYAAYEQSGRTVLWSQSNRGYAKLAADLDAQLLAFLQASVSGSGSALLDLGCGTGHLAKAASHLVRSWNGVDLRPEAIHIAQEAFPDAEFTTASADEVPFADGSFDVVVARVLFSSLRSSELEARVAQEIARVLRPSGWLVWLDLRYANPVNSGVHAISERRLRILFPQWRGEIRSAGLLPPIARRLGPMAALLYPILASVPVLRSHLVGRMQRPPNG